MQFNITALGQDTYVGTVNLVSEDKKVFTPHSAWTFTFESHSNNTGVLLIEPKAGDHSDFEASSHGAIRCGFDFQSIGADAAVSNVVATADGYTHVCSWSITLDNKANARVGYFTLSVQESGGSSSAAVAAFSGMRRPRRNNATFMGRYGQLLGFGALMVVQASDQRAVVRGALNREQLFVCPRHVLSLLTNGSYTVLSVKQCRSFLSGSSRPPGSPGARTPALPVPACGRP